MTDNQELQSFLKAFDNLCKVHQNPKVVASKAAEDRDSKNLCALIIEECSLMVTFQLELQEDSNSFIEQIQNKLVLLDFNEAKKVTNIIDFFSQPS